MVAHSGLSARIRLVGDWDDRPLDGGAIEECSPQRSGEEYWVVKVMYEPEELQSLLDVGGWDSNIAGTRSFIFGSAQPR